jgi:hypothetical protein
VITNEERIARVETKLDDLITRFDRFDDQINKKMDDFISRSSETYAAKWVEKAVQSMIILIVTSFVGIIVYLIEKHII